MTIATSDLVYYVSFITANVQRALVSWQVARRFSLLSRTRQIINTGEKKNKNDT